MRSELAHGAIALLATVFAAASFGPGSARAACLVAAPSDETVTQLLADNDGIGGTGIAGGDDGIGGTGLDDSGGIGGSGLTDPIDGIGGTGIQGMDNRALHDVRAAGDGAGALSALEGMVTQIEGPCVRGEHLVFDEGTMIEDGGVMRPASALRVGQMLRVELAPAHGSSLVLRATTRPLLEGPMTTVDVEARIVEVMGEAFRVGEDVLIEAYPEGEALELEDLEPGDVISVHGVRAAGGSVVPSWLGRSGAPRSASVRGIALPVSGERWRVGAVHVAAVEGPKPERGAWTELVGEWDAASGSLVHAQMASEARQEAVRAGRKEPDSVVHLHLGRTIPTSTR